MKPIQITILISLLVFISFSLIPAYAPEELESLINSMSMPLLDSAQLLDNQWWFEDNINKMWLNFQASVHIAVATRQQLNAIDTIYTSMADYGNLSNMTSSTTNLLKSIHTSDIPQLLSMTYEETNSNLPVIAEDRTIDDTAIKRVGRQFGFEKDDNNIYAIYNSDLAGAIQDVKDSEQLNSETDNLIADVLSYGVFEESCHGLPPIIKSADVQYLTNILANQLLKLSAKNSATKANAVQSGASGAGYYTYMKKSSIKNQANFKKLLQDEK